MQLVRPRACCTTHLMRECLRQPVWALQGTRRKEQQQNTAVCQTLGLARCVPPCSPAMQHCMQHTTLVSAHHCTLEQLWSPPAPSLQHQHEQEQRRQSSKG